MTLFQIINISLAAFLVFLFLRYLYILYLEQRVRPEEWDRLVRSGGIPDGLKGLARRYPDKVRFYTWWLQVERLKREGVEGVFAEVGVYKGESAEALLAMDTGREVHLFDTFGGFPAGDLEGEKGEAATYTIANFADTGLTRVRERLGNADRIYFYPGHFPDTAVGFTRKVALVNLDADLYKPTIAALNFFYPLLSPGGVIFIHDHHHKWPGIIQAADEFLATVPERPVFIPDANGTVVIIRNK